MKMLVTGGAGFIGSHIAEILAHEGHDVMVLDDLSGGFSENIPKNTTFIEGSITDYEFVISLFKRNRFDYVYHLAAYAAEGLSFFIKRFNYENNLIGSVNLINASVNHGVKCFVFASSIAVYGQSKPPFVEEMTPHPEDPYGISKYAVELDLHVSKMMWDLNYIIFRAHNVFGEHQNIGDKYRNVIGIFLNQIMQGKKLTVFGDGGQKRAFSYISDVAPVIAHSVFEIKAYNQVFNLGADKEYSVNYLARAVLNAMAANNEIQYLPARKEVANAFSLHDKVKRVFGYKPKVNLEEGICRMAEWAKKVGAKKSKEFSNIEVTRNLPDSWR
ncbi:MAG TPA: NAD-dependent epimerase/dehydratase family protein [Chitinivibrionales bacterium]|nr:NAD-dependent epimerase/dehydratase family protein [Chitinivibrionales bacterium]